MKTVNNICIMSNGDAVSLVIDGVTSCITDEMIVGSIFVNIPLLDALQLGHALIEAATKGS